MSDLVRNETLFPKSESLFSTDKTQHRQGLCIGFTPRGTRRLRVQGPREVPLMQSGVVLTVVLLSLGDLKFS